MIEVEKKFHLPEESRESLARGAELEKSDSFTDIYYDYPSWELSTQDTFLRQRDGKWELKIALPGQDPHGARQVDQYDEITDQTGIRKHLGLTSNDSLEKLLEQAGLAPFARITTHRTSYQKDGFTIVRDEVSYPESNYSLVEIELLVESSADVDKAAMKIAQFADRHGLPAKPVRGKLQEYCKRHVPDHYKAMIEAGVVADTND